MSIACILNIKLGMNMGISGYKPPWTKNLAKESREVETSWIKDGLQHFDLT